MNTNLPVAQMVIENPAALGVFTKYNIDYCCGGHRSLDEACKRIGVDIRTIEEELDQSRFDGGGYSLRTGTWSTALLIDFILENHHAFVRTAIPELEMLLDKVCERHGAETPILLQIRSTFMKLADELQHHMDKEELALFPAIKRLAAGMDNGPLRRIIQDPINVMEDDHSLAGDLIKVLRTLTESYSPPDFACMTFRVTYQKLREFDQDLMMHIHLENNVLFERFRSDSTYASAL